MRCCQWLWFKMQLCRLGLTLSDVRYVHQLGFEPVDEGTEGDATFPRRCQVCDRHIPVALCLLLAPGKKPRRSNLRLYKRNKESHIFLWNNAVPQITHKHRRTHGMRVNKVLTEMLGAEVCTHLCLDMSTYFSLENDLNIGSNIQLSSACGALSLLSVPSTYITPLWTLQHYN